MLLMFKVLALTLDKSTELIEILSLFRSN